MLHVLIEAQAHQDARGPRGGGMRVDRDQPFVDFTDAVIVGASLFLGKQCRTLGIGGEHRFERGRRAGGRFLRNVPDARLARHVGAALVGLVMAGDDFHQRGLARAVAADQADARAHRQRGARAVEDRAAAQAHGDAVQV